MATIVNKKEMHKVFFLYRELVCVGFGILRSRKECEGNERDVKLGADMCAHRDELWD